MTGIWRVGGEGGGGEFWRGQTRMWKHKQTDNTAEYSKKIWAANWAPEALKLIISCQKIVCYENQPTMFVYYAPKIHIHEETT